MPQHPTLASLINAIGGVDQFYQSDALIAFDLEDVEVLKSLPGKAVMGASQASGPDRAVKAFDTVVASLLLEGVDLSSAGGVVGLIAGSRGSLRLGETRDLIDKTRHHAADDAHVIFGTAFNDSLGDHLRVTIIAIGLY